MRRNDKSLLWAATPRKEIQDGVTAGGNTDLRPFWANVQYMSNETEQKLFGKISNSVLTIRTGTLPDVHVNDVLYLEKPSPQGQFSAGGSTYDDYGKGDYLVLGVVPARVGVPAIRNPTTITARIIT